MQSQDSLSDAMSVRGDIAAGSQPSTDTRPETSSVAVTHILDAIRTLGPSIVARAAEIETARRMPPDLIETLRSIGVFRAVTPHSHGGLELDLPAALEIIRALARLDGSVGWTAMIGIGSTIFAAQLPRATYDLLYRNGPDVIFAGSSQPAGKAEKVTDGWRVSGRWPFASGCQHADWMLGLCVVINEGGKPLPEPSKNAGSPVIRGFFLPAAAWRIEDTWHVAGLKGTGSHHVSLQNAVVPEANFFDFPHGVACVPGPLYQAVRQLLPLVVGAVSLGIAEGALQDLVDLANTGRQQLRAPTSMRDSEVFRAELGRIEADVRAARAALRWQADSHWRHALAGSLDHDARHVEGTQTGIWIITTCVRAVDACFSLAGGAVLYETSPLQRRLRDIHAAAQHAAVQQRHYLDAGRLLLERSAESDDDLAAKQSGAA